MTVSTRYRFDGLSVSYRVRQSGTVLILVVVILALMALIGVAYIQVSRTTLMATKKPVSGLDAACHSVVGQIQTTLLKDLYGTDSSGVGKLFYVDADAAYNKPHLSPYDYPWTNFTGANWYGDSEVKDQNGKIFGTVDQPQPQPKGGHYDDPWLASSCPDFTTPATPKWPHITNLNGIFLRMPALGATSGTDIVEDSIYSATIKTNTDTNLELAADLQTNPASYETYGADADGDGILDSRWTWTPLRRFGNLVYVCAVRIIDNSSMINVNTATHVWDATDGKYDDNISFATNAPRWWFPNDLDMGTFVLDIKSASYAESRVFLNYRLNPRDGSKDWTTWGGPTDTHAYTRYWNWRKGAALYGNINNHGSMTGSPPASNYRALASNGRNVSVSEELELRYKNGLNNKNNLSAIEDTAKGGMGTFLRKDDTENAYTQVNLTNYSGTNGSVQDYFQKEPRHQMTTLSGSAIFAPRLPSDTTDLIVKKDINHLIAQADAGSATAGTLSNEIKTVLNADGTYSIPAAYDSSVDRINTTDKLADLMSACLKTYAQPKIAAGVPGNKLYEVNGQYGIAALPFITEVYVQRKYQSLITTGSPNDTLKWTPKDNDGYAIEIRNPFRCKISLDYVNIRVGSNDWGTLKALSGQDVLDVGKSIVLYRNSGNDTSHDNIEDMVDTTSASAVPITKDWPVTNNSIDVELLARNAAGATLTWGYQKTPAIAFDDFGNPITYTVPTPITWTHPAYDTYRYHQYSGVGNGNDLNILTIRKSDFRQNNDTASKINSTTSLTDTFSTWTALGKTDKTGVGGPADIIASGDLPKEQIVFSDEGAIRQIGELAHMVFVGPSATRTIPDAMNARTSIVDNFTLDFIATARVGSEDIYNIPHADLLLERLTTLSPEHDGADNDGDGTEDNTATASRELFVPGTVNLNTIPKELLRKILPIYDNGAASSKLTNLVNAITDYRDNFSTSRVSDYRANRGIAYMGELYRYLGQSTYASASASRLSGKEGKPPLDATYPVIVDFLSNDGTQYIDDTKRNDPKQLYTFARFLNQVATTRSDIFTAYVVVRGYRDNDYGKGPVESATFIAVFDRSGVTSSSGTVKLLAYQRIN